MNVISYEKAYCLFPLATLEGRVSLLSYSSHGRSERRARGAAKYTARGFRLVDFLSHTELAFPHEAVPFSFGPRWVGDSDTWVIPLDMHGILPPPPANPYSTARTHDPVALCSFSVTYSITDGTIMDFSVVESQVLKYSYIVGDEDIVDYLDRILTARTWEEEYKVTICCLEDWQ